MKSRKTRIRYGYRLVDIILKHEGWCGGRNLVYRIYGKEGLILPRRRRAAARRR